MILIVVLHAGFGVEELIVHDVVAGQQTCPINNSAGRQVAAVGSKVDENLRGVHASGGRKDQEVRGCESWSRGRSGYVGCGKR